jgi:hypothetical protein
MEGGGEYARRAMGPSTEPSPLYGKKRNKGKK